MGKGLIFILMVFTANLLATAPPELINGKPRIKIWTPNPVDVELGLGKHKKQNGDNKEHNRLIDSAGANKKNKKSPKQQLMTNENAPKNSEKTSTPPAVQDNNPPVSSGSAESQSADGTESFGRWYPVCMFIDESLDNAPNEAVKKLVDEGANCYVNVIVFPVTIASGYPGDSASAANTVNEASRNWCNVDVIGAKRGSATVCVRHEKTDDWMCDPKPSSGSPKPAGGCAQKRGYPEEDADKQGVTLPTGDGSVGSQQDGVLASIEDRSNCTPFTVNHEAVGHSAIGWPNGSGAGFGIQNMKAPASSHSGESWASEACTQLQNQALPDDARRWRYDRNRATYYVKANDPIDLTGGGKLFQPPDAPPKSAPKIMVNRGVPNEEVFSNEFFDEKNGGDSTKAENGSTPDPEKHKKNPGQSGGDGTGGGKQTAARSDLEDPKFAVSVPTPSGDSRKSSSQSLTMDEGVSENPSKEAVMDGGSGFSASAGAESSRSGGSTVSFDEAAKEGGSAPVEAQVSIRKRGKNKTKEEELDPNFFRKQKNGREPAAREKGSALRKQKEEATQ